MREAWHAAAEPTVSHSPHPGSCRQTTVGDCDWPTFPLRWPSARCRSNRGKGVTSRTAFYLDCGLYGSGTQAPKEEAEYIFAADVENRRLQWFHPMAHLPQNRLQNTASTSKGVITGSMDVAANDCARDADCVALCRSESTGLTYFHYGSISEEGFEQADPQKEVGAWTCIARKGQEPVPALAEGILKRLCFKPLMDVSNGAWTPDKVIRMDVQSGGNIMHLSLGHPPAEPPPETKGGDLSGTCVKHELDEYGVPQTDAAGNLVKQPIPSATTATRCAEAGGIWEQESYDPSARDPEQVKAEAEAAAKATPEEPASKTPPSEKTPGASAATPASALQTSMAEQAVHTQTIYKPRSHFKPKAPPPEAEPYYDSLSDAKEACAEDFRCEAMCFHRPTGRTLLYEKVTEALEDTSDDWSRLVDAGTSDESIAMLGKPKDAGRDMSTWGKGWSCYYVPAKCRDEAHKRGAEMLQELQKEMRPLEDDLQRIESAFMRRPPMPVQGFGSPLAIQSWAELGCPLGQEVLKFRKKCNTLSNQFAEVVSQDSLSCFSQFFVRKQGGDWAQCCSESDPSRPLRCRALHQENKIMCPGCKDQPGNPAVCLSEGLPSHEGGGGGDTVCVSLGKAGDDKVIFLSQAPWLPLWLGELWPSCGRGSPSHDAFGPPWSRRNPHRSVAVDVRQFL